MMQSDRLSRISLLFYPLSPMQIISSPEAPPTRLDDYLLDGSPLVVCAEAGISTIQLSTQTENIAGDGAPFLLLFDEERGYTALLALVAGQIVRSEGGLSLVLSRTSDQIVPVAVAARADEPQRAIHRAMERALKLTGSMGKLLIDKPPLPRWLDRAGWVSTGSASHEGVLKALDALPFHPGYVLLRDWDGGDPERFPSGLRGLASALRERGIPHLGIEHPIGDLSGATLGNTFQHYYDFYGELKAEGVTFAEVDHRQCTEASRTAEVAIQAAASIQFNTVQFNRHSLATDHLFNWTTARLATTDGKWHAHLRRGLWLQHLMMPIPPTPTDEMTAMLNALSGAPILVAENARHLDKLLLPSGRIPKANAPLTLTNDTLFTRGDQLKGFTYKAGCGVVAAFGASGMVSSDDFGGYGTYALHSYRKGYLGRVDGPVAVDEPDIFTFAPIVDGVGLLGHPHFYLAPGPIQEMRHDDEAIHISSQVTGPLLLYCTRNVLEIRCNGEVVPWGHDRTTGRLVICAGRPLIEQPSLYTLAFES